MTQFQKYAEYKPSGVEWLGDVPKHWEVKKFKRVFYEIKKRSNSELNCGSISFGKVVYKDDEKIPESTKKSYQVVLKGDFLVNPLNLNYDLISLRIALSEIDVVVSSGYIVLSNSINLNKSYFKWFLHRFDVEYLKLLGSGVRQTLNYNDIGNCDLIFPPFAEQTAIANYLDEKTAQLDTAIAQKQRMIELLKERRQILIHRAVTQGLDPSVKMKDSGVEWIGEVPEHWEVKRLRHIGKCQNGVSKGGDYFGSGFPFVSYGDVYKNIELPKIANGLAQSSEEDRKYYSVEEGDVFFTRTSETVEEIAFASTCIETIENAIFSGFLIRFRQEEPVLYKGFSKFYFSSKTHRPFFVREMNLVIRASLSQELLRKMPILIPPFEEQILIAEYIETQSAKIEKAIRLKEEEIAKLKEYKGSLINSVVTGKVRVV